MNTNSAMNSSVGPKPNSRLSTSEVPVLGFWASIVAPLAAR